MFLKLLTEEILSITADSDQGSYAKPLLCKRYPLTRGCSVRKSLFLNFAENAKVAATGIKDLIKKGHVLIFTDNPN